MKAKDIIEKMVKSNQFKFQYAITYTNKVINAMVENYDIEGIDHNGNLQWKSLADGSLISSADIAREIKSRAAEYEDLSKDFFNQSIKYNDSRLDHIISLVEDTLSKNDVVFKPQVKNKHSSPAAEIAKAIKEQFYVDNVDGEFKLRRFADNLMSEPVDPMKIILGLKGSWIDLEESNYQSRESQVKLRDKVVKKMGYPDYYTLVKDGKENQFKNLLDIEKSRHSKIKSPLETIPFSPEVQRKAIEEKVLSELGYASINELPLDQRAQFEIKKQSLVDSVNSFKDENGVKQSIKNFNVSIAENPIHSDQA